MELGQRLRQARTEAGLSQRQLCGEEITRNMLSQIENGTARPSMDTLRYLAGRLGKPLSYFLEEDTVTSPNQEAMARARASFGAGDFQAVLHVLESYRPEDAVFDQERGLLLFLSCLELAKAAAAEGRLPYGAELLTRAAQTESIYITPHLRRQARLLTAQVCPDELGAVLDALEADDAELLLRARYALEQEDAPRAARLLEAAQEQSAPKWNFLRGEAYAAGGDYRAAIQCYHRAEEQYPRETASRLERCYRELEDYKMAYHYACKQR